ncbi:encapsulin [Dapis sp. BLCC M126]|uniref:encapsulin n=1 Tax=Dapis sp. BLCC M126 TaxID=3400189 RepID=UPI003CF07FB4
METNQRNRNQIPWEQEIWDRIDTAVHDECKRTKIAAKFLPIHVTSSNELTIPSDTVIVSNGRGDQKLSVDEVAINPLLELVVEFKLTVQQVEREAELGTAVTLATRAANLISQAEDIAIFQGDAAVRTGNPQHPLFRENKVTVKSGSAGIGLLNAPEADGSNPIIQIVTVPNSDPTATPPRWGENSFGGVSTSYSRLQSGEGLAQAHYGPYVCVFNFEPYADSYAPLPTTLIIPADRIKPLVTEMPSNKEMQMQSEDMYVHGYYPRYYGTGTLPKSRGLFLSLGGNTMDLVVGVDAKTEYTNQDKDGNYCFRVYERFALRLKDKTSVIRLEFQEPTPPAG